MKKIFAICFSLIVIISVFTLSARHSVIYAEETNYVKVITNCAQIYEEANNQSPVILTANHKEKFSLLSDEVIGVDSLTYYQIQVDSSTYGFINTQCVIVNPDFNVENLVNPNACFRKKINTAKLYEYKNNKYSLFKEIQVNTTTPIKILDGYDRHKEFTLVQMLIDNEICNIYVKTEQIKPFGIPKWLKILLYILSSLVVGALITWLTIMFKKIIKNKKTN